MSEVDEIKEFIGYLKAIFALTLAITVGLMSGSYKIIIQRKSCLFMPIFFSLPF